MERTSKAWNQSVIGKFESFLQRRYRLQPIVARMMAVSLVSTALSSLEDYADDYGKINCGLSFWWVAKSSIGKSPPLTRLRQVLKSYNSLLLVPTRLVSTSGLSEWVTGRKGKVAADGTLLREATGAHPVCFFLVDELSKYVKGMDKDYGNDLMEWHSQADDKYIEGAITRTYGHERDAEVYQVFFGTGTEYLLEKIEEGFFKQGWGNKIQFLCTQQAVVEELPPNFFHSGGNDVEFEKLSKEIVEDLKYINTFQVAECLASELWIKFHHWVMLEAEATHSFDYSYIRKLPYVVLKLATIYAANIHDEFAGSHLLNVRNEMMLQAIEDGLQLYKNWVTAHEWWVTEKRDQEDKEPQTLTDLEKIMYWVVHEGQGYCSTPEIKAVLNASNVSRVKDKITLGVDKGWLEVVCEENMLQHAFKHGMISEELFKRFSQKRGSDPNVWKITEEGRRKFG